MKIVSIVPLSRLAIFQRKYFHTLLTYDGWVICDFLLSDSSFKIPFVTWLNRHTLQLYKFPIGYARYPSEIRFINVVSKLPRRIFK